jgi:hypothetical protein
MIGDDLSYPERPGGENRRVFPDRVNVAGQLEIICGPISVLPDDLLPLTFYLLAVDSGYQLLMKFAVCLRRVVI